MSEPSNVVSLADARQSRPETCTRSEQVSNAAHAQLLPFRKTAHGRDSKAQRIAHLLTAEEAANVAIQRRIIAVAKVLNLTRKAQWPALSLKHQRIAAFCQQFDVNVEWLIGGTGRVFNATRELMLDLAVEFELRLGLQEWLKAESERRWNLACRLRYRVLGVDPDDKKACAAVERERYDAWVAAHGTALRQLHHHDVWREFKAASRQTKKIAHTIFKVVPHESVTGFLIRLRVLAAVDIYRKPPDAMMVEEIRAFAGKWYCSR